LIVDDCEVNRKVASLMLKKLGYEVDLATNGIEAIEALEHQSYDAILMDITIRPNVPYIKVSSDTNSSTGGTDGTSR